mmetsp:Transcript_8110/g.30358  ORF Transcript_8110/g.30358 Transcript_8110/m.30358 type:complete len:302 (-) Transcript_8110:3216-4121(-)
MNRRSISVKVLLSKTLAVPSEVLSFVGSLLTESFPEEVSRNAACAQSVALSNSGAVSVATLTAACQSPQCAHISMASLGLSAITNARSALAKSPSSSRNKARFKYISAILVGGNFPCFASTRAYGKSPVSTKCAAPLSKRPNFFSKAVPKVSSSDLAHAYATCLDADPPPPARAALTASSQSPASRNIVTASFHSPFSTNIASASPWFFSSTNFNASFFRAFFKASAPCRFSVTRSISPNNRCFSYIRIERSSSPALVNAASAPLKSRSASKLFPLATYVLVTAVSSPETAATLRASSHRS